MGIDFGLNDKKGLVAHFWLSAAMRIMVRMTVSSPRIRITPPQMRMRMSVLTNANAEQNGSDINIGLQPCLSAKNIMQKKGLVMMSVVWTNEYPKRKQRLTNETYRKFI